MGGRMMGRENKNDNLLTADMLPGMHEEWLSLESSMMNSSSQGKTGNGRGKRKSNGRGKDAGSDQESSVVTSHARWSEEYNKYSVRHVTRDNSIIIISLFNRTNHPFLILQYS